MRRIPEIKELGDSKKELKGNEVVKQPIARIPNNMLPYKKSTAGRKKKYTPTKMKNQINKYFDWCEENDRVPSIKGMMIHLKMFRDQFYQYKSYPEFTDIMEAAQLVISEWCENDVYHTPGKAGGKIAYMKNIHGWTEKIDSVQTTVEVLTPESARAKIEMFAPKILEILRSNNVINQLVEPGTIDVEVVEEIPSLGLVEKEEEEIEYNHRRV